MFSKNKKAVSALVATVLLILITVAAVGIIWGAIMPMLNRAMEMGQACLQARVTIDTTSGYTCYDADITKEEVHVMVARGAEEFNLAGMQIGVSGAGQSKTFKVYNGTADMTKGINIGVKMISQATYGGPIELPDTNEERTYVLFMGTNLTITQLEGIKVAPIAKIGNTERVCGISSNVPLTPCS